MSYAMLFLYTIFLLVGVTIGLDLFQQHSLKIKFSNFLNEGGTDLYVYVFKILVEVALVWLIVSFIGQIYMGWIKI